MKKYIIALQAIGLSAGVFAQAPDSVRLSLQDAERIFLQKNLMLLAHHYYVDAAKANEIQEKLYGNPSVSTELAAYGSNHTWFDIGPGGQKSFSIDQLILLAGKRNKRVLLAREQTRAASLELYELVRTLKYELRQSFYSLVYAGEIIQQYDEQMRLLQQIIASYEQQVARNNVPLKDVVRLKTEYIQLSADRNSIMMEAISARQGLQLLLDTNAVIVPVKEAWPPARELPDRSTVIRKALQNRPDLQLQESRLKQEQLNYSYQKALATPDITLGAGYDQNGSYVSHLYTVRAAIDLPFFNRNQGNIRAARAQVLTAGLALDFKQSSIEKEVAGSLDRLTEAEREYQLSQQSFNKDFPDVNRSVIDHFNKGNISILEFLDFFENYNTAIRQLNQLQKQRRLAWEELEYTTGSPL